MAIMPGEPLSHDLENVQLGISATRHIY